MGKSPNPHGLMLQIARRYRAARSLSSAGSAEKQLPWLETNEVKEGKVAENVGDRWNSHTHTERT